MCPLIIGRRCNTWPCVKVVVELVIMQIGSQNCDKLLIKGEQTAGNFDE